MAGGGEVTEFAQNIDHCGVGYTAAFLKQLPGFVEFGFDSIQYLRSDAGRVVEFQLLAGEHVIGLAEQVGGDLQQQSNWSRVVLYGGMHSSPVTVEQNVQSEGKFATDTDFNLRTGSDGLTAWSPYIRLANSQSTACVQAWLSSDFDTLNYHTNGARLCA